MKIQDKIVDDKDYGKSILYVPASAKGDKTHNDVVEGKLLKMMNHLALVELVSGKDAKGAATHNPPQPVHVSRLVWK